MLSRDKNRVPMQIFAPEGAIAVTAGTVDVKDYSAITTNADLSYRVRPTDPWMPFVVGDVLGVGHLVTIDFDTDTTIAFMR
jgi:hypothetical protein